MPCLTPRAEILLWPLSRFETGIPDSAPSSQTCAEHLRQLVSVALNANALHYRGVRLDSARGSSN